MCAVPFMSAEGLRDLGILPVAANVWRPSRSDVRPMDGFLSFAPTLTIAFSGICKDGLAAALGQILPIVVPVGARE